MRGSEATLTTGVSHPPISFADSITTTILTAGAVVLVVATYLLPLLVGLGVTQDPSAWELGFFTTLGKQVGGCESGKCLSQQHVRLVSALY